MSNNRSNSGKEGFQLSSGNDYSWENEKRARRREIREEESIARAIAEEERMRRLVRKNALGDGRLSNLQDAIKEGLTNKEGLFLGILEGRSIFYNGDSHLMNYGLTRSGKGRDIILPNLARGTEYRSLVVNDIKDGENAYASSDWRASQQKHVYGVDPHGMIKRHGMKLKRIRLNPFQHIIDHAQSGSMTGDYCLEMAACLAPFSKNTERWITEGAQDLISIWLEWMAFEQPENCHPAMLYRFANINLRHDLPEMVKSKNEHVSGVADEYLDYKNNAPEQWSAYASELKSATKAFRSDGSLAESMSNNDFDLKTLKQECGTIYLMADSNLLASSAKWSTLMITSIVNQCARAKGRKRVTFIIDELANLPYMDVLPKALTLYAGKGVQLWGFSQGRDTLRARGYSNEVIKTFETQSGVFHTWDVKDNELRQEIEKWSGMKTVYTQGQGASGGGVASSSLNVSATKRPVLQAEDIARISEGKQIVKTNGGLYILDRVPWFTVDNWKDRLKDVRDLA